MSTDMFMHTAIMHAVSISAVCQ